MFSQVSSWPAHAPLASVSDSARRDTDPDSFTRARQPVSQFPELDCVRHLLPFNIIAETERRAREIGVGGERVLIQAGVISEEDYVKALARHLSLPFERLDGVQRQSFPLDDNVLITASVSGLLHLQDEKGSRLVVALREKGFTARKLCMRGQQGDLFDRVHLTASQSLQDFVERHCGEAIARRASNQLKEAHPQFSAAHSSGKFQACCLLPGALVLAAFVAVPDYAHFAAAIFFSFLFVAWTALRLISIATFNTAPRGATPHPHDLPEYSIIVALHREAAVVAQLIDSLNTLRYPREKLSVLLVVEPDDDETREALNCLALDPCYQIVIAPASGPRAKPKALNAALPFVRGEFVAVYDAEDRPDPDKILGALACFWRSGDKLACVQGRLTIDNTADSLLTRLFTAEYCGLFDVLLPALARWRLPLPLGGSSNHFRVTALTAVGGWDPYNVTEDADLGMRLARQGYKTAVIASTTYEEAPAHFSPWLRQRSRWFKGWLQTWIVHMRAPRLLYRELGPAGFVVFQLIVGGTALAALVHPFFLGAFIYSVAHASPNGAQEEVLNAMLTTLHGTTFFAGYLASGLLALAGLMRRQLFKYTSVVLLMPVLWVLLSIAAWRALFQLVFDPYRWEKTEHGLAKTSRQDAV